MPFSLTAQSCWGQWRSLNSSWHAPTPQEHQLDQELDWPSAEKIQPDEEARVTSSFGRGSQEQKGPSAFQTGLKTEQAPTVGSAAFSVRCRNICWAPSTVAPLVTLWTPLLVHAHACRSLKNQNSYNSWRTFLSACQIVEVKIFERIIIYIKVIYWVKYTYSISKWLSFVFVSANIKCIIS